MGFLLNPNDANSDFSTHDAQVAADKLGRRLVLLKASTDEEIDLPLSHSPASARSAGPVSRNATATTSLPGAVGKRGDWHQPVCIAECPKAGAGKLR